MYQIIFYTDYKGNSDIANYIYDLRSKNNSKDAKIRLNKITAYINQLSKHGVSIGEPFVKHLEDEIWELRPLRDRILIAV
ncbi:MAG: type II toxin-antitoxin system RelE/ParE family toxin [Clostridia bacterium]|nr:type II toxin-antitoxin system RelE/ParE family toxin [Clostridia bacterium]